MRRRPWWLLLLLLPLVLWSAIAPTDRATWLLEALPVLLGAPLLLWAWPRFVWTPLALCLMLVHAAILLIGAHYTYAEVPAGLWLRDAFDLARNHYDRLGHLAQGFVPAILAREVLLRRTPLRPGLWLVLLTTSCCLAFSAFYELIEWWVAVAIGADANAFLATQGDPWDTQWDMFLALVGALASQLLLSGLHERELVRLQGVTKIFNRTP
ncbi:DUF2238 domain-containing protein [Neisseriaceae bacterium B2N2-7]|uniref:DUF2238 domain-containing protein n=1 Tax=Craterilacuibacter sinensis TaxID=2686017 RepID=A0A845BPR3_9NEIS|nr:DUF2238 domain-containing protein [Craterilacuibacter sinensis]